MQYAAHYLSLSVLPFCEFIICYSKIYIIYYFIIIVIIINRILLLVYRSVRNTEFGGAWKLIVNIHISIIDLLLVAL